ncbi:MAG: hypothetical protein J7K47_01785 [Thermoplasmata archaeon]|nr:hypothetical protein [Thermoplasmata archaeon]
MKGLVIGIVVIFLMVNAVGTGVFHEMEAKKNVITLEKNFDFRLEEKNGFYMIFAKDCAHTIQPYKPVMPYYVKTYVFPFGAKIRVSIEEKEIEKMGEMKIMPSYMLSPPLHNYKFKLTDYNENIVYPDSWYKYELHSGLINGSRSTILKIYFYPARYINGSVYTARKFYAKVEYELPENTLSNNNFDLLIVTPSKFLKYAQELANFKESHGIKTKIATMDEIKSMNGRDDAEKLKYYIKNEIEQDGIKYVLLFGGRKPGVKEEWWVPVRYANVAWPEQGEYKEIKYVTDLYFADIYDGNGSFSSWDSNNNGVYGEWPPTGKRIDDMDLYPDVYIGRLACRNGLEAKVMVEKIISYESGSVAKKVVGVGGDNFDDKAEGGSDTDYYEGEVVTNKTIAYLTPLGFEGVKVWASQEDVAPATIKAAIGEGAMFVHLHGHGSPIYWSTHKPHNFNEWEKGLSIFDAPTFFNKGLPIMVWGGCHTAMFNVSLTIHAWTGGLPAPEGISWWFARKYGGGAIASLGYSCFPVAYVGNSGDMDDDGIDEPDCVEGGYGYMELGLFEGYSKGITTLGELWGYSQTRYINTFDILSQRWEIHTVHGFTLLGDPTLKIGGY